MKFNIHSVGVDSHIRPAKNKIQWSGLEKQVSRFEKIIQSLVTGRTRGSPLRVKGNVNSAFRRGDACHRPAGNNIQLFSTQKQIKNIEIVIQSLTTGRTRGSPLRVMDVFRSGGSCTLPENPIQWSKIENIKIVVQSLVTGRTQGFAPTKTLFSRFV